MDKADERLKALFALDEPPQRDPAFSASVIERLARREYLEDMALLAGASLVGAGALWATWPSLQPALVTISQGLAPATAALAIVACAWAVLSGRAGAALRAES
jgi:hypothetical protein